MFNKVEGIYLVWWRGYAEEDEASVHAVRRWDARGVSIILHYEL